MGTWSHDAFGNDEACDCALALARGRDLSAVEGALDDVAGFPPHEYLETPEATQALVAAEAVARLRGHPGERDACSKPVDDWVARTQLAASDALAARAVEAIERILGAASELADLWGDSPDDDARWRASMHALKVRLLAPARPVA
ncbi:MAG TPA: DUF4259 domain-containing protein [Burkholderiaceae bacterium]